MESGCYCIRLSSGPALERSVDKVDSTVSSLPKVCTKILQEKRSDLRLDDTNKKGLTSEYPPRCLRLARPDWCCEVWVRGAGDKEMSHFCQCLISLPSCLADSLWICCPGSLAPQYCFHSESETQFLVLTRYLTSDLLIYLRERPFIQMLNKTFNFPNNTTADSKRKSTVSLVSNLRN